MALWRWVESVQCWCLWGAALQLCGWGGLSLGWALGSQVSWSPWGACCSLCFSHWSGMESSRRWWQRPAVLCRGWQGWGFRSDAARAVQHPVHFCPWVQKDLWGREPSVCSSGPCQGCGGQQSSPGWVKPSPVCVGAVQRGTGSTVDRAGWAVAMLCHPAAFSILCWAWSLAQRFLPSPCFCLPPLLAPPATCVQLVLHRGSLSKILGVLVRLLITNYPDTLFEMLYRSLIVPDRVLPFPCLYTLFSEFRNVIAVSTDHPGHHCFSCSSSCSK